MPGDYSLYINGQWCGEHGPAFASHNPADGNRIWQGFSAYEPDVQNAVAAAREAFGDWACMPLESRIGYLKRFGEILNQEKNAFAEAISMETGKPLWESKTEVASMVGKIDISIDAFHKRCAELTKEMPPALSITRHRPHGVVAVFGPYNFPGHLPNGHIIPALLAGNTVIFKPSEFTPAVGEKMIKCWEHAGLPKGVINLLQGSHETGRRIAENPGLDGLYFTGSWNTGKYLSELFARRPEKILALEMGGNNPLVIGDVSDRAAAAYLTVQSAYLTSGQRCTCARRLILEQGKKGDEFLAELISMVGCIKVGAYNEKPEPFMGPVISRQAAERLLSVQEDLQSKGGRCLVKMERLKEGTGLLAPGLMDVTDVSSRPDEEYFGPFLQLIRVKCFDGALKEANNTSYGLAAGLLSDNPEQYEQFYRSIRAGVVNWNTPTTGASSAAPFGGIGRSGNHRPSAYYASDYCSYPVASMENKQLRMPSTVAAGINLEFLTKRNF